MIIAMIGGSMRSIITLNFMQTSQSRQEAISNDRQSKTFHNYLRVHAIRTLFYDEKSFLPSGKNLIAHTGFFTKTKFTIIKIISINKRCLTFLWSWTLGPLHDANTNSFTTIISHYQLRKMDGFRAKIQEILPLEFFL